MAETLYTIPINEAFEAASQCPFCTLEAKFEAQALEYTLSPAMMEPDVRAQMNRLGFCREHYSQLLKMKNRLSLALILASRLEEIHPLTTPTEEKRSFFGGSKSDESQAGILAERTSTCYICSRVDGFMEKALSNAVYLWKSDKGFRERFNSRDNICLSHTARLLTAGENELRGRDYGNFKDDTLMNASRQAKKLRESLGGFTRSFDHRYSDVPLREDEKSAVESVIAFLSGE